MSKLAPLKPRRSLNEQAFAALRDFITGGGLRDEGFVSAGQIARDLGVSVTPVKEALKRLEGTGLVQILPQRGVRLAAFDAEDIRDIYDLREGLEALALDLAPRPFPPEPLARMAAIVEECEAYVRAQDLRRYTRADIRFHEALVDQAHERVEAHHGPRVERVTARCDEETRLRTNRRVPEHRRVHRNESIEHGVARVHALLRAERRAPSGAVQTFAAGDDGAHQRYEHRYAQEPITQAVHSVLPRQSCQRFP